MATPKRPAFLGRRGRLMWVDLAGKLGATHLVVLEEACRMADRLDELDKILRGDVETWVRLRDDHGEADLTISIDSALTSSRTIAATLRTLVSDLVQAAAPGDTAVKPEGGASASDDLRARRAERLAAAAVSQPAGL